MPLYDYRCRACQREFEALVRGSERAACPACGGSDLEQLLSLFAVSSANIRQANLQAARKNNSKRARDKAIAEHEAAEHHDH